MYRFDVLTDWYFCSCIKSTAYQTKSFLANLHAISNPESTTKILVKALDELEKMEIWERLYATPRLLQVQMHPNFPNVYNHRLRKFFEDFLEYFPEELNALGRRMINHVFDNQPHKAWNELELLVEHLMQEGKRITIEEGTVPYLSDSVENLPQFLSLLLIDWMHTSESVRSEFGKAVQKKEEGPFNKLLNKALEHQLGRLAFLAGCSVFRHYPDLGEANISEILEATWFLASDYPELEPDLLQVYVGFYFLDSNSPVKEQIDGLISEYQSLQHLRFRLRTDKRDKTRFKITYLKRAGSVGRIDFYHSLCAVYWQAALIALAVDLEPAYTADRLSSLWTPPSWLADQVSMKVIEPRQLDRDMEEEFWTNLARAKTTRKIWIRIHLGWGKENKVIVESGDLSMFVSPWFPIALDQNNFYDAEKEVRYDLGMGKNPAIWHRLIHSVQMALEMLRAFPTGAKPAHLLHFLVHGWDVIDNHLGLLNELLYGAKIPEDLAPFKLYQVANGLLLFAKEQADLLAWGFFSQASPDDFVQLLNTPEKAKQLKYDQRIFLDSILPSALVNWVYDSYGMAVPQQPPTAWLDPDRFSVIHQRMVEVENSFRASDRLVSEILRKYLFRLTEGNYEFDWRPEGGRAIKQVRYFPKEKNYRIHLQLNCGWTVRAEQLLLTPVPEIADWAREGDKWSLDRAGGFTHFVIAIERYSSLLSHLLEEGNESSSYSVHLKSWRSDLKDHFNLVDQRWKMGRLIQLRLTRLLEELAPRLDFLPDPEADGELIELLVSLLLEFGSPYDLSRIVRILFSKGSEPPTLDQAGFFLRKLRQLVLQSMAYYLQQEEGFDLFDREISPYQSLFRGLEREVMADTFEWLALQVWWGGSGEGIRQLREFLQQYLDQGGEIKQQKKFTTRWVDIVFERNPIEYEEEIQFLKETRDSDMWLTKCIHVDPNREKALIQQWVPEFSTFLREFFTLSDKDRKAMRDNEAEVAEYSKVLGSLKRVKTEEDSSRTFQFDCGLDVPITLNTNLDIGYLEINRFYHFTLQWDRKKKSWALLPDSIEPNGFNFFLLNDRDRNKWVQNLGSCKELPSVLAVFVMEERNPPFRVLLFNCGFVDLVALVLRDNQPLPEGEPKPGEHFWVDLIWWERQRTGGGNNSKFPPLVDWKIDSKKSWQPAFGLSQPSEFFAFFDPGEILREVDGDHQINRDQNLEYWFPDAARFFFEKRNPNKKTRDRVRYKIDRQTNLKEPFYGYLTDLLLETPNYQECLTLAFIEKKTGKSKGQFGMLFSGSPGRNYRLYSDDFTLATYQEVLRHIQYYEKEGTAAGLLIVLRPVILEGRVQLELVEEIPNHLVLKERYPRLIPIDNRNIRWRRLFEEQLPENLEEGLESVDGEEVGQIHDTYFYNESWRYNVPQNLVDSHFPKALRVEFGDGKLPARRVGLQPFIVRSFMKKDQLNGTVQASSAQINELDLNERNQGEQRHFADWWLGLKEKCLIDAAEISHYYGELYGGMKNLVAVATRYRIVMMLDVCGITMRPVDLTSRDGKRISMEEGRMLEIAEVRESELLPRGQGGKSLVPKVDPDEFPEEIRSAGEGVGIFYSVPRGQDVNECRILWTLHGGTVTLERLTIQNLEEFEAKKLRIEIGYLLRVKQGSNGNWEIRVYRKWIRLQPLWRFLEEEEMDEGVFPFLRYDKTKGPFILEHSPGKLIRISRLVDQNGTRISIWKNPIDHLRSVQIRYDQNQGGYYGELFPEEEKTRKEWKLSSGIESTDRMRGVTVEHNRELLVGLSNRIPEGAQLLDLSRVGMYLNPIADHLDLFSIARFFSFTTIEEKKAPKLEAEKEITNANEKNNRVWLDNVKKWSDIIRQWCIEGTVLEADSYDPDKGLLFLNRQDCKFPILGPHGAVHWGNQIWIPEDEGPFLSENYPNSEIAFTLQGFALEEPLPENLFGSLRRHHWGVKNLWEEYGAVLDESVELQYVLYFAQANVPHPDTGESCFRFEWGFGKHLLVPIDHLRVNGGSFEQTHIAFFIGDRIRRVSFSFRERIQPDEPVGKVLFLHIEEIDIAYSPATEVYLQRVNYNFVHLLHLEKLGEELRIKSVEGIDDRFENNPRRTFSIRRAELKDIFRPAILERMEGKDHLILGRLDENAFLESFGLEVQFDHVWLSLEHPSPERKHVALPIATNSNKTDLYDTLFFRLGRVDRRTNDYSIELLPPENIHPNDIDTSFENIQLLRRQFSAREDLLQKWKVFRQQTGKEYQTYWAPVRIIGIKGGTPIFSMVSKVPPRKVWVLFDILKENNLLYAVVLESSSTKLTIELRPSVFVDIEYRQVESAQEILPFLERGDRIRIELANSKQQKAQQLRIEIAAPGDWNYLSEAGRPVVALPFNIMLKKEVFKDSKLVNQFGIGGLPNLHVFLVRDRNHPGDQKEQLLEFMSRPHPKTGLLKKKQVNLQSNHRISPNGSKGAYVDSRQQMLLPSPQQEAGRIRLEKGWRPQFEGLDGKIEDLDWHNVTFAHASAKSLVDRLNKEKWEYHDSETGYWEQQGTEWKIKRQNLEAVNGLEGPLFFHSYGPYLTLRYPSSRILDFGFPVDTLIQSLQRKKQKESMFTFVGLTHDADSGQERIWVELAPGRVAELPRNLVILRIGLRGVLSMAHFNWQNLAAGDQIRLRLASEDPLEIENLQFLEVIPSVGNALGPNTSFVPIANSNPEEGALTLGAGTFTLTLPFATDQLKSLPIMLPLTQGFRPEFGQIHEPIERSVIRLHHNDFVGLERVEVNGYILTPSKFSAKAWTEHKLTRPILQNENLDLKWDLDNERLAETEFLLLLRHLKERLPLYVEKVVKGPHFGKVYVSPHFGRIGNSVVWAPPKVGDTVFLRATDEDRLEVIGYPELRQIDLDRSIEAAGIWKSDPLFSFLGDEFNDGSIKLNYWNFLRFMRAAGNVLPVTFSQIDQVSGTCTITRKNQYSRSALGANQVTQARVIGMIDVPDAFGLMLLRFGSELRIFDLSADLSGIPETKEAWQQVTNLLSPSPIWIRSEEGKLYIGHSPEIREEVEIKVISSVVSNKTNIIEGWLCRSEASGKLYWMPAEHFAWTSIPIIHSEEVINRLNNRIFNMARLLPAPFGHSSRRIASFTQLRSVQLEFRRLSIGSTLTIEPFIFMETNLHVHKNTADFPHLAITKSGMIIRAFFNWVVVGNSTAITYRDEETIEYPVEIVHKIEGQYNELTAVHGESNYQLDFPDELRKSMDAKKAISNSLTYYRNDVLGLSMVQRKEMVRSFIQEVEQPRAQIFKILQNTEESKFKQLLYAMYRGCCDPEDTSELILFSKWTYAWIVASRWIKYHQQNPSIELPYFLMGVLLLQTSLHKESLSEDPKDDVWKKMTLLEALWNLGLRALRSQHLEVLSRQLINRELEGGNLANRMRYIRNTILNSSRITSKEVEYIRRFCDTVAQRPGKEYKAVAAALAMTIGYQNGNLDTALDEPPPILGELISLIRFLPPRSEFKQIRFSWFSDDQICMNILRDVLRETEETETFLLRGFQFRE